MKTTPCKNCIHAEFNPLSNGYTCELEFRDDYTPKDIYDECCKVEKEYKDFIENADI